jgi:DNA-binding NtrC family response regulator
MREGLRVHVCSNWLSVKETVSVKRASVLVINLEMVFFNEQLLLQELEAFGCAALLIGDPGHRCLRKHFRCVAEDAAVEIFVSELYAAALSKTFKTRTCEYEPEIPLVGTSPAIIRTRRQIRRYAQIREPVLITGETGTGKNIVAEALHVLSGRSGSYRAVNCSAFSSHLFESEMFGHEKGSFTGAVSRNPGFFEKSNRGTLFLDEIGDMPLNLQPKILKAIEEHTYYHVGGTSQQKSDVRIVSATGLSLSEKVKHGTFRADLYYRINTFSINLPPLRERIEDIPELITHFLCLHAPEVYLSTSSIQYLCEQEWPGNVRQLFSFLRRALVHHPDQHVISIEPEEFELLYGSPEYEYACKREVRV